jgi:hypothetical protein
VRILLRKMLFMDGCCNIPISLKSHFAAQSVQWPVFVSYHSRMTAEEARQIVVEGINYAAYKETDSSLYDSDKNRLFGSDHYNSGLHIVKPSPWSEGSFEEKMAMLLRWANTLNASVPTFAQAQAQLEAEDSIMGRVIRLSRTGQGR